VLNDPGLVLLRPPLARFTKKPEVVFTPTLAAYANLPFGETSTECGWLSTFGPLHAGDREPSFALME
jgi:hypothetical protein